MTTKTASAKTADPNASTTTPTMLNPLLLQSLQKHQVSAEVTAVDHYRIHGGLAVESDYIVTVRPFLPTTDNNNNKKSNSSSKDPSSSSQPLFESFEMSKTYSAFRTFAQQLHKATEAHDMARRHSISRNSSTSNSTSNHQHHIPPECFQLAKYCQLISHLIDSQKRSRYLGKVNYLYVKVLSRERTRILNDVLEATVHYFPTAASMEQHAYARQVALIIQTFFLTHHCLGSPTSSSPASSADSAASTPTAAAPGGTTSLQGRAASKKYDGPLGFLNKAKDDLKLDLTPLDNLNPLKLLNDNKNNKNKQKDAASRGIDSNSNKNNVAVPGKQPPEPYQTPQMVVPLSCRHRRSVSQRKMDDNELNQVGEQAQLLLDDDRPQTEFLPSYTQPVPVVSMGRTTVLGRMFHHNPLLLFLGIAAVSIRILKGAAVVQVRLDGDVALLVVFACFCLGLHTPRPMVGGFDRPPTMMGAVRAPPPPSTPASYETDKEGRQLLYQSMKRASATTPRVGGPTPRASNITTTTTPSASAAAAAASATKEGIPVVSDDEPPEEAEFLPEHGAVMGSPMAKFPDGAAIGSHTNCWSDPDPADFIVRGPNYTTNKKKMPSDDFLFPCRGLDLFLTDACPAHVGRNPLIFGGRLREKPTFLINFRLPWGVLLFYFEIPAKFVPFLEASGQDNDTQKKQELEASLGDMTPAERTACRFLMGSTEHKNQTLKLIPMVIDGPWVVRQVVGGKPAIIGNKLPVEYVYEPASVSGTDKQALYLEADLDIAASSAARGILSVVRGYTHVLTLNLGFVVQGNEPSELPEQMLVGVRLHGIDPLTAPAYPPLAEDVFLPTAGSAEEEGNDANDGGDEEEEGEETRQQQQQQSRSRLFSI